MKKIFGKSWLTDTAVELLGSALTGIAVYNFAVPAGFPMTGFSGLALIAFRLWKLPIGWTTIVLNIPVAILCYKLLGRGFFFRSVRCMILSSLFVDYVAPLLPLYQGGRLLAAICTGVLGGIGYAMIYLRNSSTGGSDFIVMAVKAVRPHVQLGRIIFATDAAIILLGGIIFRDFDGVIYGLIIDYIYAIVTDKIMYGMNAGKLALVVTDHGKATADKIDELVGRGAHHNGDRFRGYEEHGHQSHLLEQLRHGHRRRVHQRTGNGRRSGQGRDVCDDQRSAERRDRGGRRHRDAARLLE